MLEFVPEGNAFRLARAGCEVVAWSVRLEGDGEALSGADAVVDRLGAAPLCLRYGFPGGIRWELTLEELPAEGRVLVRSTVTNTSPRAVRLGKAVLFAATRGVRLGGAGADVVCLSLAGLQTPRWIYRIADPACPRESKVKAQFFDRASRRALQVGFLTFRRADTVVRHSASAEGDIGSLEAWCDFAGWELSSGASTPVEAFTVCCGRDPCAALESWARHAARLAPVRSWPEAPLGWVGWAWVDPFTVERYEDVVVRNAEAISRRLAGFGLKYVWVSIGNLRDGAPGNWLAWNEETFPHGHEWLVRKLAEHGLTLGLWCGAFWVCPLAEEAMARLGEAILPDPAGKPLVARAEWQFGKAGLMPKASRPPVYALDPTHPETLAFLREVFTTWRAWGVRYYMVDFLHAAAGSVSNLPYSAHHDRSLVAGPEAYHRGLAAIREAAGEDTYLLGSTGPTIHNTGVLDAVRTGNDFGEGRALYPDSYFYPATFVINSGGFWTGPLHALLNQATSYYTHRVLYLNDSGNVLTVDKPLPLSDAQVHATIHAMSGGPSMLGDDVDRLDPERLELVKKTLPRPTEVARPLRLFDTVHPDAPRLFHRAVRREWGRHDVVAVYNFSGDLLRERVELAELGLDPAKSYLAWEFWNGEYLGTVSGALEAVVPPRCVRVYRLAEDRGRPEILGTDMHILMGEVEVASCLWDGAEGVLRVVARRPAGEAGSVYIRAPRALRVANPRGLWIAKDARDSSLLIRARLEFESAGEASVAVRFVALSTVHNLSEQE